MFTAEFGEVAEKLKEQDQEYRSARLSGTASGGRRSDGLLGESQTSVRRQLSSWSKSAGNGNVLFPATAGVQSPGNRGQQPHRCVQSVVLGVDASYREGRRLQVTSEVPDTWWDASEVSAVRAFRAHLKTFVAAVLTRNHVPLWACQHVDQ